MGYWKFDNTKLTNSYDIRSTYSDIELKIMEYVKDKNVLDLGCGNGSLTKVIALYAKSVVGVDKEFEILPKSYGNVKFIRGYFTDAYNDGLHKKADVLLLSWPVNYICDGFMDIVKESNTIIYLGKNTDGIACGPNQLWMHLVKRGLLCKVSHVENTLLIYGNRYNNYDEIDIRDEEEAAGLLNNGAFEVIRYGQLKKTST